jgi:hypothetical protein
MRKIKVPNSYYVPTGTARLLSPQHWAHQYEQEGKSTTSKINQGITCTTNASAVVLK